MPKSNVLTTGGSGFLGRVLSRVLTESGFKTNDLQDYTKRKIDISTPFRLDSNDQFDIVIHAAGKAHSIPRSKEEEESFYAVNLQGTKNLCAAIDQLKIKPKSFIFISTVSVYGVAEGVLIDESYPKNGITPYAKSKLLAESFLVNWSNNHDIKLGVLRLPLIVGPNPPGNLGAMIRGIKGGRYVSIGKADAKKSMVWAEDIAKIIPTLAEAGGTYNLTDGYHPSFGELEKVISAAFNKSSPISIPLFMARALAKMGDLFGGNAPITTDKLIKITSTLTFSDSRARDKLGWTPVRVLDKLKFVSNEKDERT